FSSVLPAANIEIVKRLKYFVVENIRSARRFLKRCDPSIDISALTFYELNRHVDMSEVTGFIEPLRRGEDMGVMSDAGCPAIADPGALIAALAQEEGYRVKPLVGPSSILMGLMASGFNGQGFAFHGYLPADAAGRAEALRRFESESQRRRMTHIFIETPYRNRSFLSTLVEVLHAETMVCVACDLTDPEKEWVRTLSAGRWREELRKNPAYAPIEKRPAVFLLYAGGRDAVQQTKKKRKN
ncbi:MAG: SAM-dependent methyltransferase, partial [Muribaculaceae bacterium]|nr:SAM-dependent methyltransferase [Muribaculaceae bacterium]